MNGYQRAFDCFDRLFQIKTPKKGATPEKCMVPNANNLSSSIAWSTPILYFDFSWTAHFFQHQIKLAFCFDRSIDLIHCTPHIGLVRRWIGGEEIMVAERAEAAAPPVCSSVLHRSPPPPITSPFPKSVLYGFRESPLVENLRTGLVVWLTGLRDPASTIRLS